MSLVRWEMSGALRWEFYGKAEKYRKETHYRQAIAEDKDGKVVKYQIGDCASMVGSDGGEWIGIITDFYHDSSEQPDQRLRVILRWFYAPHHIHKSTVFEKDVPTRYDERELYFSDDIDYGDNPINVINGKVQVFQDMNEFRKARNEKANCYLVRGFYRPTPITKPRLRLLEAGELCFLLNKPTNEEMYERYARAYRARKLYMPKKNTLQAGAGLTKQVPLKKRYHAGARQLEKFTTRHHDEVDKEMPINGKEKERSILDDIYNRRSFRHR